MKRLKIKSQCSSAAILLNVDTQRQCNIKQDAFLEGTSK
jgi:hypothetical protein